MKKYLNILYVTVISVLFITSCGNISSESEITIPLPVKKLEVTPAEYDFGMVNAGDNKSWEFTITSDGYIESSAYIEPVMDGFILNDIKKTLKKMTYDKSVQKFTITFIPKCAGKIMDNITIHSGFEKSIKTQIQVKAEGVGADLKPCSSLNPKITLEILPKEVKLLDGVIRLDNGTEKDVKVIDLDNLTNKKGSVTIKAYSKDRYIEGGIDTELNSHFTGKTTSWHHDNKTDNNLLSTALSVISFNNLSCRGPAADRIYVYGINGDNPSGDYLYLLGTGKGVRKGECVYNYPARIKPQKVN